MTIQLDITNACNLNCKHCYHSHHKNDGAISLEDWAQILKQYKKLINRLNLLPDFVLCGGEPFISPNFIPILDLINKMFNRPRILVLTNGTILKDNLINKFQKYDIAFQISLDGFDSITNDKIRGEGNFTKTINNLKRLQDEGFSITILSTLSHNTSKHLKGFFQLGKKYKIRGVNFTRFISQGEALKLHTNRGDRPLTPLELRDTYQQIFNLSKKYRINTSTSKPLFSLIDSNLGGHAKFGTQGLVVDYKGNLKVSSRTDVTLGNILKEGLEHLFLNNSIMKSLRQGDIEICGKCQHFKNCGGDRNASYAHSGSFLKVDPGCWIINENLEIKGEKNEC